VKLVSPEHERVARRFWDEVVNGGRLEVVDQIATPDVRIESPFPDAASGLGALKRIAGELRRGFPDIGVEIEDLFGAGDHVAVRWRTGTHVHRGPYRGIPPTGRHVELTGIQLARLEGDRIAETWLELDELAAARTMGLVPAEGIPPPRLAAFVVGSAFRFAVLDARHGRSDAPDPTITPTPGGMRSESAPPATAAAAQQMDQDEVAANVAVVHRIFDEVINRGNLAAAEEVTSPTTQIHVPFGGPTVGPHALRMMVGGLRGGFPDLVLEIDFEFGVGDRIASRWRSTRQTHLGPYRGIPPTGRTVETTGIDIFRFENGRVEELWMELDQLSAVRQMGVIPAEGVTGARRALFTLGSVFRMGFLEARHGIARPRTRKRGPEVASIF
jgi:predicted ester cyclase